MPKLYGALWFPDWPLFALARHYNLPPLRPLIITHRSRVRFANRAAIAAGVRSGMRQRHAIALLPEDSTIQEYANIGDIIIDEMDAVLTPVSHYAAEITIVRPGLLILNISAIEKYFGHSQMILDAVALPGLDSVLGIAPTHHGAILAARGHKELRSQKELASYLDTLPISTLRAEASLELDTEMLQTLEELGLGTLKDVRGLGNRALITRFGKAGQELVNLLDGDVHPMVHRADLLAENPISIEQKLDEPVHTVDEVVFIAQHLATKVNEELRARGLIGREIRIEIYSPEGECRQRLWRTWDRIDSQTIARLIRWQVNSWTNSVDKINLVITDAAIPTNLELAGIDARGPHPKDEVIARLAQNQLLIPYQSTSRGIHDRVEFVPYGMNHADTKASVGAIPGPYPGTVVKPPKPATIRDARGELAFIQRNLRWNTEPHTLEYAGKSYEITQICGPWPEGAHWWEKEKAHPIARIQVVVNNGEGAFAALWTNGQWFIEGIF
ncbi:MAG: DNA polymerase Y family protein [Corynebacterium sp.]|nr:DNA polymerase Y family protein [Corynebacterium sp.]